MVLCDTLILIYRLQVHFVPEDAGILLDRYNITVISIVSRSTDSSVSARMRVLIQRGFLCEEEPDEHPEKPTARHSSAVSFSNSVRDY